MKKNLTRAQYLALKKYEDEQAHNEMALRIRQNVYDNLVKLGHLKRVVFLQSRITPSGRAALAAYEDKAAKNDRR